MKILCWEGYESDSILGEFGRRHNVDTRAEALLSDAATAEILAAGAYKNWDVVNINNPWVRDFLDQRGLIRSLEHARFGSTLENLLPEFDRLNHWATNDGGDIVGVCQRFGAFNLVVNTNRIDQHAAEDQGFDLANDPQQRFGILTYDDFNLFHVCIGAGLNPFAVLNEAQIKRFTEVADDWFSRAAIVSDDHLLLNRALVDNTIDFYISGGVYTVSEARLQGFGQVRSITPARGCIDGLGGIVFAEITAVLEHENTSVHAEDFLDFITTPEIAVRAAATTNTLNPVAQMGDPDVFRRFTAQQLDAIQWDTLSEDVARCAPYQIPPNHTQLRDILRATIAAHSHLRA